MRGSGAAALLLFALLSLSLTSLNPFSLLPACLFAASLFLKRVSLKRLLSTAAYILLVGGVLPLTGGALPPFNPLPAVLLSLLSLPLLSSSLREGPDPPLPLKVKPYLITGLLLTAVLSLYFLTINLGYMGLLTVSAPLTEVFLLTSLTLLTAGLLLGAPTHRRD